MLRMFLLLGILLVMAIWFNPASNVYAATGAEIPTEGGTWTSPTIAIVITPASNMPWFKASYTYDVNYAIARWAKSLIAYTDSYGSYYLGKLSFVTCVSGVNDTLCGTPNIRVQFIQSFGSQSAGLGLTSVRIQQNSEPSCPQQPRHSRRTIRPTRLS